jgi:hypothetical protein
MKNIIVIALLFIGCNSKIEFPDTNLKSISINQFVRTKDENSNFTKMSIIHVCTISNTDSISVILSTLNSKHKVFAIFIPDYSIELNYKDSIKEVSINGKYLKINGRPFKIRKDLSKYFATMQKH